MAANIPGFAITATKNASGTVRLDIYSTNDGINPSADLRFSVVLTSANFTSINTTVNGGSTGATLTFVYPQNQNPSDYLLGTAFET